MRGFSVVEIMVVFVILGIVTTFALIGITQVKSSFQLSNNADILKAHLERAFADAKKRHALGNGRAQIAVISNSAYTVTVDFDGDGVLDTRTITLTDQVKFVYNAGSAPVATIDWRGNIAEGEVLFTLRSYRGETTTLDLTSTGDSSIDTTMPASPTITVTTTSTDVRTGTVVVGNSAPNPNPSPTPTPTPVPFCTGSQKPAVNFCRCAAGKIIDSNGNCK